MRQKAKNESNQKVKKLLLNSEQTIRICTIALAGVMCGK